MTAVQRLVPLVVVGTLAACGGRPTDVSPAEIPEIQARLEREPQNGELVLRYAAALFSANRCDTAVATARAGMRLAPSNAVGPLIVGQCLEQAGDPTQAISVYRTYMGSFPDTRGIAAVRAREMLAVRAQATGQARAALQRESQLSAASADPQVVAVLPLQITGDSAYLPLSRGLAQIMTSDLGLLQRFRMVERMRIGALLDEIQFSQGQRVDPSTSARVGRLMQAGRLVQGLAAIPDERNVRLEASVVRATGEVTGPESTTGRFRDLLQMEKQIVIGLATQLGYTLSEAERQTILENGTQSLAAFLAYSSGLAAEDLGDYSAAAAYYSQAVQSDPGFQAARQGYQASQSAPAVQQASAGQVTTVAAQAVEPPAASDPVGDAIGSTVGDIAATQAEQVTEVTQTVQQATSTNASAPPPPPITTTVTATGTIRIIFRLP